MTPTRLIAALAAVAVGFGITLVGVAVADDPVPTEAVQTESAPSTTAPSIDSVPVVSAIAETGALDPVEAEPVAVDTTPTDTARSQASRDEALPAEPVQGESTTPVRSESTDRASGSSSEEFPCSDDAFDALTADLSRLETTELIAETDLFLRVVANELASFGGPAADEWSGPLDAVFDSFGTCIPAAEQVFVVDSTAQFFCASASVSADDRLFEFFEEFVPARMTGCSTQRPQGEN